MQHKAHSTHHIPAGLLLVRLHQRRTSAAQGWWPCLATAQHQAAKAACQVVAPAALAAPHQLEMPAQPKKRQSAGAHTHHDCSASSKARQLLLSLFSASTSARDKAVPAALAACHQLGLPRQRYTYCAMLTWRVHATRPSATHTHLECCCQHWGRWRTRHQCTWRHMARRQLRHALHDSQPTDTLQACGAEEVAATNVLNFVTAFKG
jgi:hypothetical protein